MTHERLSVHRRLTALPAPLTEAQHAALLAVADILIPAFEDRPCASESFRRNGYLDLAIAARADSFERLLTVLDAVGGIKSGSLAETLRRMAEENVPVGDEADVQVLGPDDFHLVSSIVAGAYFMTPDNARRVGYPGQGRNTPTPTEAADDLEGGILDAVIARGPIYVSGVGE